ncbi:restriction endonuclease subunit S [Escherichia coli]|uniref:restriction endonuclease subunit S n=1 Tax=Escherichia coli TaxID=562 RepID=UPI0017B8F389|nr:restriction endonuclease subunit S [Escherichia coli]EFK2333695.1 restriction endonuclease subunit S [Escherichia coli]MEC6080961.1 restriction endonuclease subunit S [Escherichia coli]HBZ8783565.1 restriction endonuclease subunit S [Escherichia coli]HCA0634343.1 restriction endonuclease subunit S [Escherichia coli]HCA1322441.1 restriction endonuclease subunit S [Escherichia coli]
MMKISEMPKYEVYKDSGVEWLGDIPASWSLLANKHIFRLKKKQVGKRSSEYDLLSLTLRGVIKRDMENPEGKFPAEFDTYQEVQCGDFIFCLFDVEETPRTVGLSPFNGMITGAYTVFELNDNFDNRFLYYFYMNLDAKKMLKPLYRGLRNTIPKDSFLSFKTFVPPHEQQTRIANFLDKKIALIDEAISIKEKQISLLKERKQIIIQQAVTQGLDPNVPMKDSGVDWIGDIPAHWGCTAVKRLLDIPITDGPHTTPQLHDEGIPFISAEAIKGGEINFDKKRGYINEKDYLLFSNKYTPKVNDIYMVKSGATTGRVAIVRTEMKFTIWSPLAVFRVDKNKLNPLYLYYFLQSYSFLKGVELSWSFGTQQNIGMGVLGNLFALAPPLEEQQLIVNSIEPHFREIDIASEQVYQQIEKLKEYKTTLINSAVTGKIKITPEMVEQ